MLRIQYYRNDLFFLQFIISDKIFIFIVNCDIILMLYVVSLMWFFFC